MTDFATIKEALSFHTECPYCDQALSINPDIAELIDSKLYWKNTNDQRYYISLDVDSNTVFSPYVDKSLGFFYCSCPIRCNTCSSFHYIINLKLNIVQNSVEKIWINNYIINVQDNDKLYLLSNSKSLDIIKLRRTSLKTNEVHEIILPFMDIDINNPFLTIQIIETASTFD